MAAKARQQKHRIDAEKDISAATGRMIPNKVQQLITTGNWRHIITANYESAATTFPPLQKTGDALPSYCIQYSESLLYKVKLIGTSMEMRYIATASISVMNLIADNYRRSGSMLPERINPETVRWPVFFQNLW